MHACMLLCCSKHIHKLAHAIRFALCRALELQACSCSW